MGNLSFYTTEEQIYELFSRCTNPEEGGGIKRIIMGLDRNTKCPSLALARVSRHSHAPDRTPCGFCFVEYYTHAEALACMRYVSGTKLDERIVRCDLDLGYADGRQFGRGKSGGQVCSTIVHVSIALNGLQVRDEHRQDYDAGRGGWGAQTQAEKRREREELYADVGPGTVPAVGGGDWKSGSFPSLVMHGVSKFCYSGRSKYVYKACTFTGRRR